MKRGVLILLIICLGGNSNILGQSLKADKNNDVKRQQGKMIRQNPYRDLPLGNIKPKGWLKDQLKRMASGLTGHLDEVYPEVVGQRNGWLGGDGDGWERGPYWIDGLLPLAYILDDETLKAKVQPWIEWTLQNQADNGYLGPVPFKNDPEYEPGLQKTNRMDWWPKMVMLKVLQQYYNATGDERVITALTKYFKYQLDVLPEKPLDFLTLWANRRGGDNLQVVYWLYNITGDDFLLELGDLIHKQTFPWTRIFLNTENYNDPVTPWHYETLKRYPFDEQEINSLTVSKIGGLHTVNFAQGLKEPVIYFQKDQDPKRIKAVKKALSDIKKYHGQPQGMYGGDEPLHGTNPMQGIEFCAISEEMFSLESILKITGDMEFADLLEKVTYNALPAQASDDFNSRQYFQAANQIELSDSLQISFQTHIHKGTDFVFGTLSGYPCCTTNMHQSWPKYVQNLFYSTSEGGVAAFLYAPATVNLKLDDGADLLVEETTDFPFRETVNFKFNLSKTSNFPFHLRIPSWTSKPEIKINKKNVDFEIVDNLVILKRDWQDGDRIELTLPMSIKASKWHEFSTAIERGPLVYSLKVNSRSLKKDRGDKYREFTEYFPVDDWNFGLLESDIKNLPNSVKVVEKRWKGDYPWNLDNSPIEIKINAVKIPEWKQVNGAPVFPAFWAGKAAKEDIQEITLVPYGCTILRITEFPTYRH